jgi:hypothetical protein
MRQEGSGHANRTTALIEKMIAAVANQDKSSIKELVKELDAEKSLDRCGINGRALLQMVQWGLNQIESLPSGIAKAQPIDRLGDVKIGNGQESIWIELKAQTKKFDFRDITQADWVRDDTDFLRYLFEMTDLLPEIPFWVADQLETQGARRKFKNWDAAHLWLADLALVHSAELRESAGISGKDEFINFLDRKYLFHLTQSGIRVVKFADIPAVAETALGEPVSLQVVESGASAFKVKVKSGASSRVNFTYHVGYEATSRSPQVLGRHKLHAVTLDDAGRVYFPNV